ncbi:hypothetical protein BESB_082810 [Besnoitia besnoiti]|uniref:Uncharacterized protein n=1 Tax=Besnoitia besnoiti TaxID=94643 RepID=A0A2A9MCG8_BESBE|nr:hypothetical protein BESB_082810 [Besnoitia besnoiti]PFH33082.1 hypothetical protein BESB_082810 [Besnoitia besnoiti]
MLCYMVNCQNWSGVTSVRIFGLSLVVRRLRYAAPASPTLSLFIMVQKSISETLSEVPPLQSSSGGAQVTPQPLTSVVIHQVPDGFHVAHHNRTRLPKETLWLRSIGM